MPVMTHLPASRSTVSAVLASRCESCGGSDHVRYGRPGHSWCYRDDELPLQIGDPSKPPMIDSGNLHLREMHPQSQQGVCADAIATLEGIDRDAVDNLALVSQLALLTPYRRPL